MKIFKEAFPLNFLVKNYELKVFPTFLSPNSNAVEKYHEKVKKLSELIAINRHSSNIGYYVDILGLNETTTENKRQLNSSKARLQGRINFLVSDQNEIRQWLFKRHNN